MHNLDTIVSNIESQILNNHFSEAKKAAKIAQFERDKKFYDEYIEEKVAKMGEVNMIFETIEKIEKLSENTVASKSSFCLMSIIEGYKTLNNISSTDYSSLNINSTIFDTTKRQVVLIFSPDIFKFQLLYSLWNPLQKPLLGYDYLESILKLNSDFKRKMTKIQTEQSIKEIISRYFCPVFKNCIDNQGIFCQNSQFFAQLVSNWAKILPPSIINSFILNPIVLPRINFEVEQFNPIVNCMTINQWITPWKQLLKDSLNPIFEKILISFGMALQSRTFADERIIIDAIASLKLCIPEYLLTTFSNIHIVPRVASYIDQIQYSLSETKLSIENFKQMMFYEKILNDQQLNIIFNSYFFPKWIAFIHSCLQYTPNYQLIAEFYEIWKEYLMSDFYHIEAIKKGLSDSIDVINNFVDGNPEKLLQDSKNFSQLNSIVKSSSQPNNFRDLVEMKCAEKGISLIPIQNRIFDGKQVYKMGHLTIVIDSQIIYILQPNGTIEPISINDALNKV
ncbi:MAG: Tuftelin-interacting protein 11 [Paramarteilia canceri]